MNRAPAWRRDSSRRRRRGPAWRDRAPGSPPAVPARAGSGSRAPPSAARRPAIAGDQRGTRERRPWRRRRRAANTVAEGAADLTSAREGPSRAGAGNPRRGRTGSGERRRRAWLGRRPDCARTRRLQEGHRQCPQAQWRLERRIRSWREREIRVQRTVRTVLQRVLPVGRSGSARTVGRADIHAVGAYRQGACDRRHERHRQDRHKGDPASEPANDAGRHQRILGHAGPDPSSARMPGAPAAPVVRRAVARRARYAHAALVDSRNAGDQPSTRLASSLLTSGLSSAMLKMPPGDFCSASNAA